MLSLPSVPSSFCKELNSLKHKVVLGKNEWINLFYPSQLPMMPALIHDVTYSTSKLVDFILLTGELTSPRLSKKGKLLTFQDLLIQNQCLPYTYFILIHGVNFSKSVKVEPKNLHWLRMWKKSKQDARSCIKSMEHPYPSIQFFSSCGPYTTQQTIPCKTLQLSGPTVVEGTTCFCTLSSFIPTVQKPVEDRTLVPLKALCNPQLMSNNQTLKT